jgi:acid stress-induced BolA-like protein IbaG/YrbA
MRRVQGRLLENDPFIEHLHDTIHSPSIKATTAIKESRRRVQDLQSLFARLKSITDELLGAISDERVHARGRGTHS